MQDIYPSVMSLPHCKHTSSYMTVAGGGGECEGEGGMREGQGKCGLTENIRRDFKHLTRIIVYFNTYLFLVFLSRVTFGNTWA